MRLIMGTAVTCLSMTAFSQAVDAQVSSNAPTAEETALEEIVVTAQKREERLQDVPISISVLGGDALDDSTNSGVMEAVNRVPGVFAPITGQGARQGGSARISIRGVSASSVSAGTTAYYLDNVPFGFAQQSFVPDTNPYDLDRVEVLRGPQGTLYGASALNGVVRVLTKNPNFNDLEFKARASLSSTDHGSESYSGDAAFNMPIIDDKLAARVVIGYQDAGGWIDKPNRNEKDVNDTEKTNARVKLAAKLTDNFSVGLSGWFSRSDSGAPPTSADGGKTSVSTLDESMSTDFDTFGLDLNYDAGSFSIKSATSYIDYKLRNSFDFSYPPCVFCFISPSTAINNRTDSEVLSEELVLSSTSDGPWRWTLGSMYRDAQDDTIQSFTISTSPDIYSVESKSTAVYGELTREFADGRFELTGGLRYFRDEVHYWEDSRQIFPPPIGTGDPSGIPPEGLQSIESTFKKTTPRVVLTWHPSDDATLYGSYSKGFRSGLNQGFAVAAAYPDYSPAEPDTVTNYEIGSKASFGALTFDAAVYYIDWQDPQQDAQVYINGAANPAFVNGDSISGPGIDLALAYSPIDSLTLRLSYGWNDLTFDSNVYTDDTRTTLVSAKGTRRSSSPKTMAGASIDYSVALGNSGYEGRMSASGNYTSEQLSSIGISTNPFTGVTTVTQYKADSMTVARASFMVEAPQNWSATVFVDNVTNEEGVLPDSNSPPHYDTAIRPRTYGVQFEYRY